MSNEHVNPNLLTEETARESVRLTNDVVNALSHHIDHPNAEKAAMQLMTSCRN